MNRRDALNRVAWIMGGSIVGANLFLSGCKRETSKNIEILFRPEIMDLLGDIADTILPPTSSPGAKQAGVGTFIPVMVRDCYSQQEQKSIIEGLDELEVAANEKFGRNFQVLSKEERHDFLVFLDGESLEHQRQRKDGDPSHYFYLLKQLTLLGFFTSELGATQALRYVAVPGEYIGDYPYEPGDKAWA